MVKKLFCWTPDKIVDTHIEVNGYLVVLAVAWCSIAWLYSIYTFLNVRVLARGDCLGHHPTHSMILNILLRTQDDLT